MPHKPDASRRHHTEMKFKVTNWAEHETGLRRRGSVTLWITPDAMAGWVSLIAKPSVVIMPCSSTYMRG